MLVTGSTDGVGRYVAAKLASAGAKVLIHGRDRGGPRRLPMRSSRKGAAKAVPLRVYDLLSSRG
jgi:NAD(P)-dependent dehydrogenase (short-subunit alcohol dehydrogenase family)